MGPETRSSGLAGLKPPFRQDEGFFYINIIHSRVLNQGSIKTELLRAGQHIRAGSHIGVNTGLKIGKEFRRPLHLIQDNALWKAGEKPSGVAFGQETGIGIFQGQIWLVGESGPCKGCLTRLARAGDGDDRKSLCQANKRIVGCSWNHGRTINRFAQFVN